MKKLLALIFVALCTISIKAQTDDPITFADSKVKEICVANWDTNSDGELSTAEAAAVSDLGEVFESNPNINSFNELQYFTGLKSIGDGAFQYCTGLTSINIPNSVTSIGYSAFFNCYSLTDIVIPNSVVNIGSSAFECTAWYDHQSEGVVYVGKVACSYKGTMPSNTSIEFDEGTLSISDNVFYTLDNLISVTIPKSVVAIGRDAFACKNLSNIIVDADNKVFDSRDNCNAIIETATNKLIVGSVNTVIPNSVTSIGERAFFDRNLENIVIPESVTSIGDVAFYGCTFQNITIPKSVTSIEGSAFTNCNKLQTMNVDGDNHVYDSRNNCNAIIETATNKLVSGCRKTIIPNSVSSIGRAAFANDTIDLIVIPESITFIDDLAFWGSMNHKDSKIIFKSSIPPTFGKQVFYTRGGTMYVPIGCKEAYIMANEECEYFIVEYENINFADAKVKELCVANWDTNGDGELSKEEAAIVTSLGEIFKGNTEIVSFDELQYFTGLTSINEYAFLDCSNLSSLKIPNSVTNLGVACFRGCWKLQTLTIPNSVTTLNDKIFYDCGIKSITIPQSVKSIGISLFKNCPDLTTIIVEEGNPIYDSRDNCNAIIETSSNTLIASCKNTVIPQTVTTIGETAFMYCSGLTSIVVPNNVLSIKGEAFRDCFDLTSITLPNTIINIDTLTFWGCHVLESIIIPRSVKSIGDYAFGRCLQLKSVIIPSSTTTISSNAFVFCSELTSVTVGNSEPISISNFTNRTNATLYVPAGSKAAYEAASVWNEFKEIIEIENIAFADSKVKEICVANWDTNGDGELSYAEAAVSSIGKTFKDNKAITSFDELQYFTGVDTIKASAFSGCYSLVSITLPNTVKEIQRNAFYSTSLESIKIPASVNTIEAAAFNSCSNIKSIVVEERNAVYDSRNNCNGIVETATNTLIVGCINTIIPDDITSIGESVFRGSGLTSIVVPNNVLSIKGEAFRDCFDLTSITLPNTITNIDTRTFWGCHVLESIIIPRSVKSIGDRAFGRCLQLKSVIIPSSTATISSNAFVFCSELTSVTVGNSEPISISNFTNRTNATLYVPAGSKAAYEAASVWNEFKEIIEIENIAFADSKVKEICVANWDTNGDGELSYAEAAVSSIGKTFKDNKAITSFDELQYFTGVDTIKGNAFYGCNSLVSITLPNTVKEIQQNAFYSTSLESIKIPASVNTIEAAAFNSCGNIKSIVVEERNAVYDSRNNCNGIVETATNTLIVGCINTIIPDDITSIGESVFRGNHSLKQIVIPNSVTSIGTNAFYNCKNLVSITLGWITALPDLGERPFTRFYATLYVPAGSKDMYENDDYWTQFYKIVEIENITFADSKVKEICVANWDTNGDGELSYAEAAAVTSIGQVFYGNKEITSFNELQYFTGLTSIGDEAFNRCSKLTSITIPNSVTSIGDYAFNGCCDLASIIIPNNVKRIGYQAFSGCFGLISITIPNSVTSIGTSAFYSCTSLASIIVESGNTVYDSRDNCNAIIETSTNTLILGCKNTVIPISVTSIGNYTFDGCSNLTSITIPNSVTSIGEQAFSECTNLNSITIPNSVTSIGNYTFDGCSNLTSITIPNSVTSIGTHAFYGCSALTSVTVGNSTPVELTDGSTFSNRANATLYVPAGSKEAYEAASVWNRFKEIVPIATVTINKYGSGTYCSPYALDFTNVSGMKAYVAAGYNTTTNTVYMLSVKTAQPGEGLFIKGTPGDYTVPEIETSTDNYLNLLVGTTKDVTVNTLSDDGKYTNYVYGLNKDTNAPAFYKYSDGSKCKAYKAYLQIPTSWLPTVSEAKTVNLVFDDEEPTGIEEFRTEKDVDEAVIYDMQGRRVTKPGKGLYIVNGKKVVFK